MERLSRFVYRNYRTARVLLALLMIALSGEALALHEVAPSPPRTARVRKQKARRARLVRVFRPSRESLLRQNEEIDRLELPRIQDDEELESLKAGGELVPIDASTALRFDPRLDPDRRYCRPWVRDFLNDLSAAYYREFNQQIQLNSAVRTVKFQKKLRRKNRNAAPAEGETSSSHLAGVTVDIQRRGLSRQQIRWMQQYLLPLHRLRLIEPEEERRHWVFHIMVSDRYSDWRRMRMAAGEDPSRPVRDDEVAGWIEQWQKPASISPQAPDLSAVSQTAAPSE